MKIGIDVIVGEPLTAKSVPNHSSMPKIYSTPKHINYIIEPLQHTNNYITTQQANITQKPTYTNSLLNTTYFNTNSYEQKPLFERTSTEKPIFNTNATYSQPVINYDFKG